MRIIDYNKREIKKLLSKNSTGVFNIFEVNGTTQKIYKDLMYELQKYKRVITPYSLADMEQIRWLSNQQMYIKSTQLPDGIIMNSDYPIGVSYPTYFFDYENFYALSSYSPDIVIHDLRLAVEKNIELMERGIYNYDFTFNNILFKGKDVQLIDIDGKYVTSMQSYDRVYSYFTHQMMELLVSIIRQQYGFEEAKKVILELKERLKKIYASGITIDYPNRILDEIEKSQILKLN